MTEPSVTEIILDELKSINRKLDDVVTWSALKYIGGAFVGAIVIVEFIIHQLAKA